MGNIIRICTIVLLLYPSLIHAKRWVGDLEVENGVITVDNEVVNPNVYNVWDSTIPYIIGSIVSSGSSIYVSLQDANLNNIVTDLAYWTPVTGSGGISHATSDGNTYGSKDGAWTEVTYAGLPDKPTIPSGNEIIDWTGVSAGTIHSTNYVDNDTQLTDLEIEAFGYIKSYVETDPLFTAWDKDYNDLINPPTANQIIDWTLTTQGTIHNTNYVDNDTQLTDGDVGAFGYIKTYTETDPNALLTAGVDNVNDTHIDFGVGVNQVSTLDVPAEGDSNYVTSAQLTVIGNTSGTNTGDQTVPTALSELTEDTTHRVVTDTEKTTWNGKQSVLTGDCTGQVLVDIAPDGTVTCESDDGGGAVEGTAVLSTGETGGTKFLREDGLGGAVWSNIDSVAFNMQADETSLLWDTDVNYSTHLADTFAPLASPTFTGTVGLPASTVDSAEIATGAVDVEHVEADLKTNVLEYIYSDLTALEEGKYVQVPTGASWTNAYILCDAAEATTPVEFDIWSKATISAAEVKLTAATSELTMSTVNAYVDAIDISGLTDPAAGAWVRLDISVIADTATECTVSLHLVTN